MVEKQKKLSVSTGLVGKFFHSRQSDRKLKWQGYVESLVEPSYYLVQLYSWFDGRPNGFKLVKLDQMLGWDFYQDAEEMKFVADEEHRRMDAEEGRLNR